MEGRKRRRGRGETLKSLIEKGRREREKGEERNVGGKGGWWFSPPDPCSLGSREIDGEKNPPMQPRLLIGQQACPVG